MDEQNQEPEVDMMEPSRYSANLAAHTGPTASTKPTLPPDGFSELLNRQRTKAYDPNAVQEWQKAEQARRFWFKYRWLVPAGGIVCGIIGFAIGRMNRGK